MKKHVILSIFGALLCLCLNAQEPDVFQQAERQCPTVPTGLLRAIAFTNTQCHHLTDADYTFPADDPAAMPRAYGMMGLVRDGKGWFRENLKTVSELSGLAEEALLESPAANVTGYAMAFEKLAAQMGIRSDKAEDYLPVIEALSVSTRTTTPSPGHSRSKTAKM